MELTINIEFDPKSRTWQIAGLERDDRPVTLDGRYGVVEYTRRQIRELLRIMEATVLADEGLAV